MTSNNQKEVCRITNTHLISGLVHSVMRQSSRSVEDGQVFHTVCGLILHEKPRAYACYGNKYHKTGKPITCKNCLRVMKKQKKPKTPIVVSNISPINYVAIMRSGGSYTGTTMDDLLRDIRIQLTEEEIIKAIKSGEMSFYGKIQVKINLMTTEKIIALWRFDKSERPLEPLE